jgi:flagellar M-ring protein FliF
MNEQFKGFMEVCKGIWTSLGVGQKVSIVLIGLCCTAGLGTVVYFGSQPTFHPMFTGINPDNMVKITELFVEEDVEYRLKDGGTTIEVQTADMVKMKMKVRGNSSITLSSDGANPFNYIYDMPLGMASSEKRVARLNAIQENLVNQINKMPKINGSSVTLNLPSKRAFEKQQDSSAAVMLRVRQGDYISRDQVSSIRHLVSSSVENLVPGKVTVVDSMGRLLAKFQNDTMKDATLESSRREMKAQMEEDLRRKVEDLLIPAVGGKAENVVAMVDVQYEFQTKTTTSIKYEEGVVMRQTETTKMSEANSSSSGEAGTTGNKLQKIDVKNPEKSSTITANTPGLKETTTEKDMKIPETETVIIKNGAEIKKITVSVNIREPEEGPFSPEKIIEFETLVKNAVGLMSDSGIGRVDKVSIMQNKFTLPEVVVVPESAMDGMVEKVDYYLSTALAKNIMGGVLLLGLLIFYKKIFSAEKVESQDMNADEVEGEMIENEGDKAHRLAEEAELALLEVELSKEMEAIKGASRKEPQTIATVIESWVMKESTAAES